MLIQYYRNYSTFRRIFNMLVIGLLITTLSLTLMLTFIFSRIIIQQSNAIAEQTLDRLSLMTGQMYEESYSIMLSLGYGENIDLNTMMFSRERNRLRDFSGYVRMRLLQTIYPWIAYIAVYNGQLDTLMCTVGLQPETEYALKKAVLDRYSAHQDTFSMPVNNQLIAAESYLSEKKTLNLVYYSPLSKADQIGAILLAIDCSHLNQYMSSGGTDHNQQLSFVIDRQGLVLAHQDQKLVFTDVSTRLYIQRVLLSDQQRGHFISLVDGVRSVVTYLPVPELDAVLVSMVPIAAFLNQLFSVVQVTFLVAAILITGAVFSLYATKRTFN
ncbi:MAG: hypothetical protein SCM11_18655, partial [Bacillota bacterium]|nr:hypothetical protein [Bacillota bacterium]